MRRVRFAAAVVLALTSSAAVAQESRVAADLRRESEDIQSSCSGFDAKAIVGCVVTLATDDPFHIAIGSLAPKNGTAFGLAFAEHSTPNDRWRIGWNADAVAATSGSWRAGAYAKLVYRPPTPIVVVRPGTTPPSGTTPRVTITEYPVVNVYAQAISLDTLEVEAGRDPFSERQTIVGTNVIYPVPKAGALRLAIVGAVNGRWLSVRDKTIGGSQQPAFAQFEEGVRLRPSFNERFRLNYLVDFQQFASGSDASFHRWTLDLRHELPLYGSTPSTGPKDTNGPDECFQSAGSSRCPPVSYSRDLEGSVAFRVLATKSIASAGGSVPFYFQPTLGGSDVNGQRLLAGYDDYSFRGPNLVALQESIEHSIWGPLGAHVLAEQGKVTQAAEGLGFDGLLHSFGVGLTIRAGGFPLVNLTFAWGGGSHHLLGTIDATLLGGSARPSLF